MSLYNQNNEGLKKCQLCDVYCFLQICCEDKHLLCPNCIIKENVCPCGKKLSLSDDFILEHNFTFPISEAKKILNEFITKWKSSNYLRSSKTSFIKELNENQILALQACKKYQKYKLYRGTKILYKDGYIDKFPSSWSTDINVAKKFGNYIYIR